MKYKNLYINFLKQFLKPKQKLKVIFDCSNGTTGIILKSLLNAKRLPLNAVLLNAKPDGYFPAHGPNPMAKGAMEQLQKAVLEEKADLGIIFDADGDRVFFVDNRGRPVDAHEIGFVLTQMFKPPFVVSSISSWRLKKWKVESGKLKVKK